MRLKGVVVHEVVCLVLSVDARDLLVARLTRLFRAHVLLVLLRHIGKLVSLIEAAHLGD